MNEKMEWSAEYSRLAKSEGWDLLDFPLSGFSKMVCCIDEPENHLKTDEQAVIEVLRGDQPHHRAAREIIRATSPIEWTSMMVIAAREGIASRFSDQKLQARLDAISSMVNQADAELARYARANLAATTFFNEIVEEVETLSGIAESHDASVLANLFWMHHCILTGKPIDADYKMVSFLSKLPSAERWKDMVSFRVLQ
jgi:hypothetical protein